MVIISAEMSFFCINSLGCILKGRKKLKCKQQMWGERGTAGRKAKRREEQFVKCISKFRCTTNSVKQGFFAKELTGHIREFRGTHISIFPLGRHGRPLEGLNANWAFQLWGFYVFVFEH